MSRSLQADRNVSLTTLSPPTAAASTCGRRLRLFSFNPAQDPVTKLVSATLARLLPSGFDFRRRVANFNYLSSFHKICLAVKESKIKHT